ncbi:MAG TPA: tRNA pseudouridine(13) synthase TruD, partial [Planctomycetota bacterium]|nr:tRNA pseudouridine(13) synthase TruD [Planctomycetota bacterium]
MEDFEVEEIPLGPPPGEGPHLWFELEKRGLSTLEAARRIAARLGRSAADVGHAGLKDAHARTTQWLSLEGLAEADLARAVEGEPMRVLRSGRAPAKLALGALAGNRFRVRLRDVSPDDERQARARLERFAREGVPNFFGAQRFGIRGLGGR